MFAEGGLGLAEGCFKAFDQCAEWRHIALAAGNLLARERLDVFGDDSKPVRAHLAAGRFNRVGNSRHRIDPPGLHSLLQRRDADTRIL